MSISELTRREIADLVRDDWNGRMDEVTFLRRLYPLDSLPSNDDRYETMEDDITQHTINNDDWDPDWVFSDARLPLAGDDAALVRFLAETLHPLVVSPGFDVASRVASVNELLRPDGWELRRAGAMSGRPIYEGFLLEREKLEELEPLLQAATALLGTSIGVDIAGLAFKNGGRWHFGGVRACVAVAAPAEFEIRNDNLVLFRRLLPTARWSEVSQRIANSAALGELFGTGPDLDIADGSKWNLLMGGWREEPGRSIAERLPILRARRGNGRFVGSEALHRRFLAALEKTVYLTPTNASLALGFDVPLAGENHTLSVLELEFPIRIAECRAHGSASGYEVRLAAYAPVAVHTPDSSCAIKLNSWTSAQPVALAATEDRDGLGWVRLEGAVETNEEPTGATIRLGYRDVSVLLAERPVARAVIEAVPTKKSPPSQPRVVVVERISPAVQIGPVSLPPPTEEDDENINLNVDGWRLGKRIGKGSYGRVYRAQHELTEQQAVIKLIDTRERDAAGRFRREASCLGTLIHPAIPTIHGAGFIHDDQLAYIVQEAIEGADLDRLVATGWRPAEMEVLEILRQVTFPLAVGHDFGIIHRDLKPSNLFLEDTGYRRMRVLDFGCAKLIGASKLTSSGSTVGALPYQPPEAFSQKGLEASGDVWTLGVTAYELLVGEHPFLDDDVPKTIARILDGKYAALDSGRFPILAPIVAACLQVDPDARPPNAEALGVLLSTAHPISFAPVHLTSDERPSQSAASAVDAEPAPSDVTPAAAASEALTVEQQSHPISTEAPMADLAVVSSASPQPAVDAEGMAVSRDAAASQVSREPIQPIAPPQVPTASQDETADDTFPPHPRRVDRESVREDERTEYQSELLVWPADECDIDATELRAAVVALVGSGLGKSALKMMMRTTPTRSQHGFRWAAQDRPYLNVIDKWELEVRNGGQLAYRWAKFTTGDMLLFDMLDLLDGVVVSLYLYERAIQTAAESASGIAPNKIGCRLSTVATRRLLLDDKGGVTTKSVYSPKSDAAWEAQLEARLPAPPHSIAKRLLNRALQNFHIEPARFADPNAAPPIVAIAPEGFDRYLGLTGLMES